jgi:hypothetical protein
MPTHVALLRGVDNLGGKRVAMADLQEVVTSLGHTDVMTYIQSGNVPFTPRLADGTMAGRTDTATLAAALERAIADSIGVRARLPSKRRRLGDRLGSVPSAQAYRPMVTVGEYRLSRPGGRAMGAPG